MNSKFKKKKIVRRKLSKLKRHPRQGVFRPHTQQEVTDLAESMDREGLISPVEITPDGYIICGHGRVAAAKHLGWDDITVWVRHDLAEQGDDDVFQRLLEDNLCRRQLSKLGLGRAYIALKEKEYDSWRASEQEGGRGDFRDHLGELLGCDGTTAERWAELAALPYVYDQFIESGLLTQQYAKKIVKHLPDDVWEQLGQKLAKIADSDMDRKTKKREIRSVVDRWLGPATPASNRSRKTWQASVDDALSRVVKELPEPVSKFVDSVNSGKSVEAMLRLLIRKRPKASNALAKSDVNLDDLDIAKLRRSAAVMFGLLHLAEVASE